MDCVKPIRVLNGGIENVVRCGRCVACRIHRRLQWEVRLRFEFEMHLDRFFCTLTYAEEPEIERSRRHVQLFLKRARKKYKLRYFMAPERGPLHGRLHWHGLLFSNDKLDVDFLARTWEHGFSVWKRCDAGVVSYVCKYVMKNDGRAMMSRRPGIGYYALPRLEAALARIGVNPKVLVVDGRHYPMPRYLTERLGVDVPELEYVRSLELIDEREARAKSLEERVQREMDRYAGSAA